MKRYSVVLTKSAEKELYKLPSEAILKIVTALKGLEENPRPEGCKKLKGFKNLWRIRIGNYRAIYSIEDVVLLVDVRDIGNRKDIYN
jgi:mRNA interferase RelE/StbE